MTPQPVTITGHVYRYGTNSYTTFDVTATPRTDGYIDFQRPSGTYTGHIAYMEPTNEATNSDDTRWYVHVTPMPRDGYVIVPASSDRMPWGFYVSQSNMWKLDAISCKTPA